MAATAYEIVTVTMQNGKLTCTPDWVHLYSLRGPANIRWVFKDVLKDAVGAVVEFFPVAPSKYTPPPVTPGPFRPRGIHCGVGHLPASAGSQLCDLLTCGNTQDAGYFYYNVKLLDAAGNVIAQVDPGGDNQPTPP